MPTTVWTVEASGSGVVSKVFENRASLVDAVSSGFSPDAGTVVFADGLAYIGQTGATAIPDLPGLVPAGGCIDARHFGSVGSAVNSSIAINAALAYAATTAGSLGERVHVQGGHVRCDDPIIIPAKCHLQGAGIEATRLRCGASMDHFVQFGTGSSPTKAHSGIYDCLIECLAGVTITSGISIYGAYWPKIERVKVTSGAGSVDAGINIRKNSLNYITSMIDVFCIDCQDGLAIGRDGDSVEPAGGVRNTHIVNGNFSSNSRHGVNIRHSSGMSWLGGECLGNGDRGILIGPRADESVSSHYIAGIFFDTNTGENAFISSAETGRVSNIYFSQCGFNQAGTSLSSRSGVYIVGPSTDSDRIEQIKFHECESVISFAHGWNLEYVNGVDIIDCVGAGNGRVGTGHGIRIGAGAENIKVIGGKMGGTPRWPSNQAYGVSVAASSENITILGVDLLGNATGPITGTPTGIFKVKDCPGYINEARGTATILSGTGSIAAAHGMTVTPTHVLLTPQADMGAVRWWATAPNSTNIGIACNIAVAGDRPFYWEAKGPGA